MENNHIVFGRKPLIEAFSVSDRSLDKIYIAVGIRGDEIDLIEQKAAEQKVPVKKVPKEKLNKLTKGNHQGVVAFFAAVEAVDFVSLMDQLDGSKAPLILALDGITDVRNFGAMARSAYALGVSAIIIPDTNSVSLSSDALKASAGALHHIPVSKVQNIHVALKDTKLYGYQIMIADGKGETHIKRTDFNQPTVLVMGSEEKGVSASTKKIADIIVRIPLLNDFDSLNVGVSAGILMYERLRGLDN